MWSQSIDVCRERRNRQGRAHLPLFGVKALVENYGLRYQMLCYVLTRMGRLSNQLADSKLQDPAEHVQD